MANPVIFTIDDDAEVLRAIERDLRKQYGRDYRVLRAESGRAALDALKQLKLRNEPVALLLSDQRMPDMTGVELLEASRELYPKSKRALLTAYADTDAAIRAINAVQIDYYLLKPWDPPEAHLYPVLQDLLDDWQANYYPLFDGIRIIGHRWSPQAHQVRDFLNRNRVPYELLDIERNAEAQRLVQQTGLDTSKLPLVIYPDGTHLSQPTRAQVAEKIGMRTRAEVPFYDFIIVGAGPAGLGAGVYAASEGLRTLLIEREAPGGQAGTSSFIENYLGFPSGVSGESLTQRAVVQAEKFGAEILRAQEAVTLRNEDTYKVVRLGDGTELSCHALLIATGISYRRLDIPGIDKVTGAGVYYGSAITEAVSCRDTDVYIVGAGNSAGQAAMYLSQFASRVNILCRGPRLGASMSQYLVDQIAANEKILVRVCSSVSEVHGDTHLEAVTITQEDTGAIATVPASSLFIFIGAAPHTQWAAEVVECDEYGFILSGPDLVRDGRRPRGWKLPRDPYWLETSVPGIFVAGDVRQNSVKRVASAVGEGAMAVVFVHQYLAALGN